MWTDKYVGIPYKPNGRDSSGLDCWGLVRLVYAEQYNIDLPSFTNDYTIDDDLRIQELFAQQKENWQQKGIPEAGDLVLFRILGDETHVGIVVDSQRFIHARQGSDTVVDYFTTGKWARRVVGFYKYSPISNIVVTSAPHPLKTEKWVDTIPEGATVQDIYELISKKYQVAEQLSKTVAIMVNGIVVSKDVWHSTKLLPGDVVEYRAVPGRDSLKLVALVALVILAPTIVAGIETVLGAQALTAAGANLTGVVASSSLTFAGQLLAAGIVVAGSYLINAIAPVRLPGQPDDPGQPQQLNLINGAQNAYNPYGGVPVVLGKIKYTPPLGAKSYVSYANNGVDQYLNGLLVWGYGPLTIFENTIKVGEVLWSEYDFNPNLPNGGKLTLDRKTTHSAETLANFDKIYGEDVQQQYINVEMLGPTVAEAPPSAPGSNLTYTYSVYSQVYSKLINPVTGISEIVQDQTIPHYWEQVHEN